MFKTRLLSGIVLVIILIATVGTGGGLLFGFLALISLIGLSELYKVVDVQNKILGLTGYLGAVVYYGILYTGQMQYVTLLTIAFLVVLMAMIYYFTNADGGMTVQRLTIFFTFFVMLQFWNMFNAKAFMEGRSAFANLKESKSFLFVALLILIGQYLIVTFGGEMFNVVPLSLKDWGIIIGSSSLVLWIGEIARGISRLTKK